MIGTRGVHGDAKLGTQERGTDFGNKAERGSSRCAAPDQWVSS